MDWNEIFCVTTVICIGSTKIVVGNVSNVIWKNIAIILVQWMDKLLMSDKYYNHIPDIAKIERRNAVQTLKTTRRTELSRYM